MTRRIVRAVAWVPRRAAQAFTWKDEYGAEIVWDKTRDGMDTWLAALAAQGDEDVIHIEDDAEPTAGWAEKVEAAVAERPDKVIQFFSMRRDDLTVGSRWQAGRTFMMTQCFYVPGRHAQPLRRFTEDQRGDMEHPTWWDNAIGWYLASVRERYWLHAPSLVQHLDIPSVVDSRRSKFRQSASFVP